MTYACRVFNSIDAIDTIAWKHVYTGGNASVFMDLRLIAALEKGMKDSCRFWHAVVYDDREAPMACASLSVMTVDLANIASSPIDRLLRLLPAGMFTIRKLNVLLVGLPLSAGQECVMLAPCCDARAVILALDDVVAGIAAEQRVNGVLYKEFGTASHAQFEVLLERGYRIICDASRPSNVDPQIRAARPDVTVIEAGLIRAPAGAYLSRFAGPTPGLIYACAAETMLWALEQAYDRVSPDGCMEIASVIELERLAQKHGFAVDGV